MQHYILQKHAPCAGANFKMAGCMQERHIPTPRPHVRIGLCQKVAATCSLEYHQEHVQQERIEVVPRLTLPLCMHEHLASCAR